MRSHLLPLLTAPFLLPIGTASARCQPQTHPAPLTPPFCLKVVTPGLPSASGGGYNTRGFRIATSKTTTTDPNNNSSSSTGGPTESLKLRHPSNATDGVPLFRLNLASGALTRHSPDPAVHGHRVYLPFPFGHPAWVKTMCTAAEGAVASRGRAVVGRVLHGDGVVRSGAVVGVRVEAHWPQWMPYQWEGRDVVYEALWHGWRWGALPRDWSEEVALWVGEWVPDHGNGYRGSWPCILGRSV